MLLVVQHEAFRILFKKDFPFTNVQNEWMGALPAAYNTVFELCDDEPTSSAPSRA